MSARPSPGRRIVYTPDELRRLNPGRGPAPPPHLCGLAEVLAPPRSRGPQSPSGGRGGDVVSGVGQAVGLVRAFGRGTATAEHTRAALSAALSTAGGASFAEPVARALADLASGQQGWQQRPSAGVHRPAVAAVLCRQLLEEVACPEPLRDALVDECRRLHAIREHRSWRVEAPDRLHGIDAANRWHRVGHARFVGCLFAEGVLPHDAFVWHAAELLGLPRRQGRCLAVTPSDDDLASAAALLLSAGAQVEDELPGLMVLGLYDRLAHFQHVTRSPVLADVLALPLESRASGWARQQPLLHPCLDEMPPPPQREPLPPPPPPAAPALAADASPSRLRAAASPFVPPADPDVGSPRSGAESPRGTLNPTAPAFVPPDMDDPPAPPPPPSGKQAAAAAPPAPARQQQQQGGRREENDFYSRKARTVYVVGIDTALSERCLLDFLSSCGRLARIRLCGDTNNRTIYGFFEFQTRPEAAQLMQKDKMHLGNYVLNCSWAKSAIRDNMTGAANQKVRQLDFGADGRPLAEDQTALRESCLQQSNWTPKPGTSRRRYNDEVGVKGPPPPPPPPLGPEPAAPAAEGVKKPGPPKLVKKQAAQSDLTSSPRNLAPFSSPGGHDAASVPPLVDGHPAADDDGVALMDDLLCNGGSDGAALDSAADGSAKELLQLLGSGGDGGDTTQLLDQISRFMRAVSEHMFHGGPDPQAVVARALLLILTGEQGYCGRDAPRVLATLSKALTLNAFNCWKLAVSDALRGDVYRTHDSLWDEASGGIAGCVQEGVLAKNSIANLCEAVTGTSQWFDFQNKLTSALAQAGFEYSEISAFLPASSFF